MNPWDYLEALRARWKLIAATVAVVMAAVGTWCAISPKIYTASATLLFDTAQTDPVGAGTSGGGKNASLMGTQADIIRSVYVAQRAVSNLRLDQDANVIRQYQKAGNANVPIGEWLGRRLTSPSALQIIPTKSTNVLAVAYNSPDPDFAALLANAFADAYVQTQLQLKIEPAKVYSQWFEGRIRDVRNRLEQAQARLTAFQQEKGLIGAGKIDVELARLSELSGQLTAAQSESAAASARAGSNVGQSSDAQMSGLVQGLDNSLAGKSAQLQQLRQVYGANHPAIIAAKAELAELQAKRDQAVGTAVTAVRVSSLAARAREGEIGGLVAAQRARVLKLSSVQDQMAVLQRDVDTAQANYQAVNTRLNAVRLQSEIPQTNVSQLDRALPPNSPSSPNIPARLILGLLVGVMAGVGLALALEWFSPRVRTVGGLEDYTRLPVLADFTQRQPMLRLTTSKGA